MGFKIDNRELETKIRELAKKRGNSILETIDYVVKKELDIELEKARKAKEIQAQIA